MSVECPRDGCGRDFETELGMKFHHARVHGESLAGKEVECTNCGTEFRKRHDHVENFDHHFCDEECEGGWRAEYLSGNDNPRWREGRGTKETECHLCGKTITVRVDKIEKYERNFCSEECGNAWRREYYSGEANPRSQEKYEVECSHCGSTLQRIEYYVEHNEHHFCDRDCLGEWRSENWNRENHPNWKGGVARDYGPNWKQKRRAVRQRDDFECQRCRLSDGEHRDEFGHGLHVHHVVPRAEFLNADGSIEHERANRMTNLITLCQQCHVEVEGESNRFNL